MIDLTEYYTGSLPSDVVPRRSMGAGLQTLGGVQFDVRGCVRLFGLEPEKRGQHHRESVTGIRIQQRCERIHFLHAASWAGPDEGEDIAGIVVQYANGKTETIAIQNLIQIAGNWSTQPFKPKDAEVAWIGTDSHANSHSKSLRRFRYTWTNPHHGWEISHLDLVSKRGRASYELFAITLGN